jgi:hypothetical protein
MVLILLFPLLKELHNIVHCREHVVKCRGCRFKCFESMVQLLKKGIILVILVEIYEAKENTHNFKGFPFLL